MKKRKLNYVIQNPNTVEKTADFLLEILIEINAGKVEQVLREAASTSEEQEDVMEIKQGIIKVFEGLPICLRVCHEGFAIFRNQFLRVFREGLV